MNGIESQQANISKKNFRSTEDEQKKYDKHFPGDLFNGLLRRPVQRYRLFDPADPPVVNKTQPSAINPQQLDLRPPAVKSPTRCV
jgi:hypothetical protein